MIRAAIAALMLATTPAAAAMKPIEHGTEGGVSGGAITMAGSGFSVCVWPGSTH